MIKTDTLIIGAGPVGLFSVHQLGIIGLKCEVVDNLDKIGGQCIELYPDKPIYDIPAVPECTGEELTNNLIEQIKAFKTNFHLNERVEEIKKVEKKWIIKTNKGTEFEASSIIIAAGVGSFEPRKFPTKEIEKYEGKQILYSIKDKTVFKDKTVTIFGGGDSALDWAIELSNTSKVILIHRRDELRAEKILQKKLMENKKIEIIWDSAVEEVIGDGEPKNVTGIKIKNLKTNKIDELKIDGLFIAIGHDPATALFKGQLDMDKEGYLLTKPDLTETNIPGVYAAGDVKDKTFRQAVTAAGMGCMAALEAEKHLSS